MNDFLRYGLTPWGAAPNERHMEWYCRGRTAFLHFTVNTFTDREWGDGTETPAVFAPTELDCRQWARILKEAGFTAAILTAKHHDGFCLWDSAYTEHCVRNSPCRVDVVRAFTDACREYGIKPGLYLSPWDRHHPQWGTQAYNEYYASQLTELMTGYGPIWECWWDGAGSAEARYDWKGWADIVRKYQPQCVIFGCLGAAEYADVRWVGNESGCAGDPCYATIDPHSLLVEDTRQLNQGTWGGSYFIPAEANTSIRPGWFYHSHQDGEVKSPEALVQYWFESAGRNASILLNLPPDRRGLIHQRDAESVIRWNEMLEEMFSRELAAFGEVTADAPLHPECPAENLLREAGIYAAACREPVVTLRFSGPVTFDCFRLEEVIELGHRVRGFALEIRENGQWRQILHRTCIGFCHAERIAPVTTDAIRVRVTRADAPPVLRRLCLYDTRGIGLVSDREQSPKELTGLEFACSDGALTVMLGGIYPYNAVVLPGTGWYEIHAFRGTRFARIWSGYGPYARFETVTGSYQLKLISRDGAWETPPQVRVLFDADS